MPTLHLNGTDLFYREVGTGLPCLAMHGGLGLDHTYLHPALDSLGNALRLISYDHRGNGRSGRPPTEDLTLERWVADADALRDHVGVDQVAVLGHSFGGCIGLEYALRHPERVSHLLLVDTVPALNYWDEVEAIIARRQPSPAVQAAWQTAPADNAGFASWLAAVSPLYVHPQSDPEIIAPLLSRTSFAYGTWSRSVEVFNRDYDVTERLGEVQAPTLILVGREDFICPPSQATFMQERIPNAELVIFEHSGHFPFVEEAHAFGSTVRNWLHRTG